MHPSTCCGISADNGCCCAKQAKCACGKELALQCKCGDHTVSGPRCSCMSVLPGQRPAGQCTCERSISENSPVKGPTCPCGRRPAESCTCERMGVVDTAIEALEADFTTHKLGAPSFNIFHRRNEKYGAA